MQITSEELTIIRKALQIVSQAHAVIETADEQTERETKVDAIIRKVRDAEERLKEIGCITCKHNAGDYCRYWGNFTESKIACSVFVRETEEVQCL